MEVRKRSCALPGEATMFIADALPALFYGHSGILPGEHHRAGCADATQQAVIATVNENYDDVHHLCGSYAQAGSEGRQWFESATPTSAPSYIMALPEMARLNTPKRAGYTLHRRIFSNAIAQAG
ncbi:MAG: hypothetical protein ACLSB9_36635 [Hydrogeniiclostridium mannosilyticum]